MADEQQETSVEKTEKSSKDEFIYGGPWVTDAIEAPFMNTSSPRNVQLCGIYKRSFAYHTLSSRLPIILTKVIDNLSRNGKSSAVAAVSKLKSDLVTNKRIERLKGDTDEVKLWNSLIAGMGDPYYFTAIWIFTECYVYRKLHECISSAAKGYDAFKQQKEENFQQNLGAMCVVANKMKEYIEADSNKDSLSTLIKLSLWGNKSDLSLSAGSQAEEVVDPINMLPKLKPKTLVDDSNKVADFILSKCKALEAKINNEGDQPVEPPPEVPTEKRNPCLSRMTFSNTVNIDIICDNAGYELFTDLCLGYFLITKKIANKIRYRVKAMPWFVSDVTVDDFNSVIDKCANAKFSKTLPLPEGAEGEGETINSEELKVIGGACKQFVKDGNFVVEADDYWTLPSLYKDMKTLDPNLYRKLQFAVILIFKGDLNYRKLLGEKNWPPTTSFEQSLQGFIPAPIVALRTVKADLISGLPKGKWEDLTRQDEKWMEKGEYGLIQFCAKKEDPKVVPTPCPEYEKTCQGACA